MDDSPQPSPDRLVELVQRDREQARACLEQLGAAPTDDRKAALQRLRGAVDHESMTVGPLVQMLTPFLDDDERSVRLTAAKLFVSVARTEPGAVETVVPALGDRLADEDEFYYVRARAAEALGHVALEHPDTVATPEVVAELRLGLDFDQPEVKQKLAKALEHVAIGQPERLTHQASNLADHLDDEDELVRYHLCSALAAVGCKSPGSLEPAVDPLCERLTDGTPQVRGRAAEALGVFLRGADEAALPAETPAALRADTDAEETFLAERAQFALDWRDEADASSLADDIGTVDGIRETTAEAVAAIRRPTDGDQCPHCGATVPADSPPMCLRCGAPR